MGKKAEEKSAKEHASSGVMTMKLPTNVSLYRERIKGRARDPLCEGEGENERDCSVMRRERRHTHTHTRREEERSSDYST